MKVIRIKSVVGRKLRDNFRAVLLSEIVKRQKIINDKERSLLFHSNGKIKPLSERTGQEEDTLQNLQSDWWALERLKRKSICECSFCGDNQSDMVYIPSSREWICMKCAASRGFSSHEKF